MLFPVFALQCDLIFIMYLVIARSAITLKVNKNIEPTPLINQRALMEC